MGKIVRHKPGDTPGIAANAAPLRVVRRSVTCEQSQMQGHRRVDLSKYTIDLRKGTIGVPEGNATDGKLCRFDGSERTGQCVATCIAPEGEREGMNSLDMSGEPGEVYDLITLGIGDLNIVPCSVI